MDPLEKFLYSIAYKFSKGYPDLKDKQDVLILENELLKFGINLKEANLSGGTTNYNKPTGAFYKYVELNPKSSESEFEADNDAPLLDVDTKEPISQIQQGENFKILDKNEDDLIKTLGSYATKIEYQGKEYYIKLINILKPTGKQVGFVQVDLSDNNQEDVFIPFKAGHGQEEEITQLFVNGSGPDYDFEYDGKTYKILKVGAPPYKGPGNPKTDVYVQLDKPIASFGKDLKISLKAANATFVENWMKPDRFEQILGDSDAKSIIVDIVDKLNQGQIGVKSPYMHWFVKTKPYNSVKLDYAQEQESLSGEKKFGKDSPATANCYFKGNVPETITDLIKLLKPISDLKEDMGLHIRGYGAGGNSACFIKEEEKWVINPTWKKKFDI
jgi:hypothetical protein